MLLNSEEILQNTTLLEQYKYKDIVKVSCSNCQIGFELTKRKIVNRLRASVNKKLFCSSSCQQSYTLQARGIDLAKVFYCGTCDKKLLVCSSRITNSKTGKFFCNNSCSVTYTNTLRNTESKKKSGIKTSKALKEFYKNKPVSNKSKIKQPKTFICEVCSIEFEGNFYTKTCSKECFRLLAQKNALLQTKHGSGKKGIYNGFQCDSSYELAFVIYHLDHGSNILPCNEIRSYTHNGIKGKYNPDFVVDDKVYEIKGFMSERAKSKLRDNSDIIIINKNDIKPFIKYVKDKYNIKNITDLYQTKEYKRYSCEYCSNEFDRNNNKQRFCSISCGALNRHRK